jgi:hypothetical protein
MKSGGVGGREMEGTGSAKGWGEEDEKEGHQKRTKKTYGGHQRQQRHP